MAFLAAKPELNAGGFELARAYAKLSTCRQMGMGIGPVPIDKIWEWMDRAGIRNSRIREYVEGVLTAIDVITLRRANRPQATDSDKVERRAKR